MQIGTAGANPCTREHPSDGLCATQVSGEHPAACTKSTRPAPRTGQRQERIGHDQVKANVPVVLTQVSPHLGVYQ